MKGTFDRSLVRGQLVMCRDYAKQALRALEEIPDEELHSTKKEIFCKVLNIIVREADIDNIHKKRVIQKNTTTSRKRLAH
jgi:hypothetical protein